jgi:hypothetical protein
MYSSPTYLRCSSEVALRSVTVISTIVADPYRFAAGRGIVIARLGERIVGEHLVSGHSVQEGS